MGLLALSALTCVLIPLFFQVGPTASAWLVVAQWLVVGLFLLLEMNILGAPWSLTLPQLGSAG